MPTTIRPDSGTEFIYGFLIQRPFFAQNSSRWGVKIWYRRPIAWKWEVGVETLFRIIKVTKLIEVNRSEKSITHSVGLRFRQRTHTHWRATTERGTIHIPAEEDPAVFDFGLMIAVAHTVPTYTHTNGHGVNRCVREGSDLGTLLGGVGRWWRGCRCESVYFYVKHDRYKLSFFDAGWLCVCGWK